MKAPWERFEEHCQDVLGLSGTLASGGHWHDLGDGVERDAYAPVQLIIDAKTTVRGAYSLNAKMLRQWTEKATTAGKRFLLPLRFIRETGPDEDYVVLGLDDFAELLELAREGLRSRGV